MAKFGVLMLEGGVWKGKRLLSEPFVRDSLRVQLHGSESGGINIPDAPALGLIWFLETEPQRMMRMETMEKWRAAGVSGPQIEKIQPYLDKPMPKTEYDALVKRLYGVQGANDLAGWRKALGFSGYLPTADDAPDRLTAFYHSGSDGQYLVVFPQSRLVVVRQTVRKDLRDIGRDSDYSAFLKDASLLTGRQIFDVTH
jgi:CubicO group peptidase (beta-lactamase class C family)